jgi:hypothetical protein
MRRHRGLIKEDLQQQIGFFLYVNRRRVRFKAQYESMERRIAAGAIQSDAITLRLFVIWVAGSDLLRASCFWRTWPNRTSSRRFYD